MRDDYSVKLVTEIRAALLKQGYVLKVIGQGMTRDIQVNNTDVHRHLKANCRKLEKKFMLRKLSNNSLKTSQSSRNDMMKMLGESFKSLQIDFSNQFKALWVTNH